MFFLFFLQVKLVDVEKVEWLNRRSYSAIGLLLGREGRVLLRCDDGLEDWFELLEVSVCVLNYVQNNELQCTCALSLKKTRLLNCYYVKNRKKNLIELYNENL